MNYELDGYKVLEIFNQSEVELILNAISNKIKDSLNKSINKEDLEFLHKNKKLHNQIVSSPKRYIELPQEILKTIKNNLILNNIWETYSSEKYTIFWTGSLKEKLFKKNAAGFRLVRPEQKQDAAGPHTDKHIGGVYTESNIRFFSIWIPLNEIGCKESLALATSSHKVSHPKSELAEAEGKLSIGYKQNYFKKFKIVRPLLKLGQGIAFDGNLMHGGAFNTLEATRISIEIRFYPQNLIESIYQ